jgi:competence protein ComEA
VAAILVAGGVLWFGTGSSNPVPDGVGVPVAVAEPDVLAVHVSGAVIHPGLVTVPGGSRVADAIAAAGGATVDAELARTNLAAPVRDGEHILVASVDEPVATGDSSSVGIDLNAASASELEALPGVGPVVAERIVAHRDRFGPFVTVEDLLDVPGIGEAKLAQMREAIGVP